MHHIWWNQEIQSGNVCMPEREVVMLAPNHLLTETTNPVYH